MVEETARRRSEEIRVKLSPALAQEFAVIAAGKGLLPATLAAVALGEYCEKWRQQLQLQRMVAVDMSKRMSEFALDGDALGKAISQVLGNSELLELVSQQPSAGAQA